MKTNLGRWSTWRKKAAMQPCPQHPCSQIRPAGLLSICSCHVPQPLKPLQPRASPAASHEKEWSHLSSTALHVPLLCRWTLILITTNDPVTSWATSGQSTWAEPLSFQQQIGKNWKIFLKCRVWLSLKCHFLRLSQALLISYKHSHHWSDLWAHF